MDYSIVLPAYNEESYLPDTLDSLSRCMAGLPDAKGEIIVVDNNSTDRTASVSTSKGARVAFEEERGIGKARNRGALEASGELLFFVDADTIVPEKTFIEAYELMSLGKAGAGGSTLRFDQTHGKAFLGLLLPSFWNWASRTFKLAAGSFIFCRKDVFRACSGFPEKLYAGEEIFFSRKAKAFCRRTGTSFRVLTENPVVTSSRKLIWHSGSSIFLSMLLLLVFPLAIRSRKLCSFWYERPEEGRKSS